MRPRLLLAVLCAGLAVRLGYGWLSPPQRAGIDNTDDYVQLAFSVCDQWSLYKDGRPSAHREPVYPIALGLVFKIFGKSYLPVLLLNSAASILALALLFNIGARLFGPTVAALAAGVAAFYPYFIFYAAQTQRESFMLLASAAAIWSFLKAQETGRYSSFAAAGLLNALAALTNTTFLPFALTAPAGFLFFPGNRAFLARKWLLYFSVFVALYSLWPLRNYRVFGTWILGSTAGAGSTFYNYLVVRQEEGGTRRQSEIVERDPVYRRIALAAPDDPVRQDKLFWKEGWRKVFDDPLPFFKLFAWRFFWDEWRVVPRPRNYAHSYERVRWASLLSDGWIIPLGFLGMFLAGGRPRAVLWVYLFIFLLDFTYSMVLTMVRYRVSMMPWMILFASLAICRAADQLTRVSGSPGPSSEKAR